MLELQGVARRAGAGCCTLALVGLCLGATAPASFADERAKPAKHAENHGKQATFSQATPAKAKAAPSKAKAAPSKAKAAPQRAVRPMSAAKHPKVVQPAQIKLDDLLLPGALGGVAATDSVVRRPSALVVTPAVTVPETTAPLVSVVVKKAPKAKAGQASTSTVSAEALLDVTTVSPVAARNVLAPRRLASTSGQPSVGQVASARAAAARAGTARKASAARAALPGQVVNRDASRVGAWPTGPESRPSGPTGLPMTVALGGLVLALAAARGVARMRHPRTDDPDLSFTTA